MRHLQIFLVKKKCIYLPLGLIVLRYVIITIVLVVKNNVQNTMIERLFKINEMYGYIVELINKIYITKPKVY